MTHYISLLMILTAIAAIGLTGYQVGQIIGKGMAESAIINYFNRNKMSLSEELIRDMYPMRFQMNPVVERPGQPERPKPQVWVKVLSDQENRLILMGSLVWLVLVLLIIYNLYF